LEHQRTQAEAARFRFDQVLTDHGISGISTRLAERPQGLLRHLRAPSIESPSGAAADDAHRRRPVITSLKATVVVLEIRIIVRPDVDAIWKPGGLRFSILTKS
jgi:hypothetical protein